MICSSMIDDLSIDLVIRSSNQRVMIEST